MKNKIGWIFVSCLTDSPHMKVLPFFALLLMASTATAQWSQEFDFSYGRAMPSGKMSEFIKRGNGMSMGYYLVHPNSKLAVGLTADIIIYGYDKSTQQYEFPDGTSADMDITVNNSFSNLMLAAKYYLATDQKLQPYLSGKAGYSFYRTNLGIYDPDDWDSCEPVEDAILSKDGTTVFSFGGGLKYDMAGIFKKMSTGMFFLDASLHMTRGGRVSYMNADGPDGHQHMGGGRGESVEASFINTQTQVIHKHHVGYLYTSAASMTDLRIGFSFRYGRMRR